MESEKLMPCPFCETEEILLRERWANGTANRKHYRPECSHCGATFVNWYRSIKNATAAWNMRKTDDHK